MVLLLITSVYARDEHNDWYASIYGGAAFPMKLKNKDNTNDNWNKFKTGGTMGLEVGQYFNEWRFGLEAGYKTFDNKDYKTGATEASDPVDGHLRIFSLMANVYYDYAMSANWSLYAGGGIGYGCVKGKFTNDAIYNGRANTFAYQLMAGVGYDIAKNITLGVGYRFFGTTDPKIAQSGNGAKKGFKNLFVQSVEASVRYSF